MLSATAKAVRHADIALSGRAKRSEIFNAARDGKSGHLVHGSNRLCDE